MFQLQDFKDSYNEILSPEAINFLIELHNKFNTKRIDLLEKEKKEKNLSMMVIYLIF